MSWSTEDVAKALVLLERIAAGYARSHPTAKPCPKCGGAAMPLFHQDSEVFGDSPGGTCGWMRVDGAHVGICPAQRPFDEHLYYACVCKYGWIEPTKDSKTDQPDA